MNAGRTIRLRRFEPGNNTMEMRRDGFIFVSGSVYPEDFLNEHFPTGDVEAMSKPVGNLPWDAFIVRLPQITPPELIDELSKLNYGDVNAAERLLVSVFQYGELEKRKSGGSK